MSAQGLRVLVAVKKPVIKNLSVFLKINTTSDFVMTIP